MGEYRYIDDRVKELIDEIDMEIKKAQGLAVLDHRLALVSMTIGLMASFVAGVCGLVGVSSKITGSIAFVPGFLALIGSTFKFEGRSTWHFRKKYAYQALKYRLMFKLPVRPSNEEVGEIMEEWIRIKERMLKEWDDSLELNWGSLAGLAREKNGGSKSSEAKK